MFAIAVAPDITASIAQRRLQPQLQLRSVSALIKHGPADDSTEYDRSPQSKKQHTHTRALPFVLLLRSFLSFDSLPPLDCLPNRKNYIDQKLYIFSPQNPNTKLHMQAPSCYYIYTLASQALHQPLPRLQRLRGVEQSQVRGWRRGPLPRGRDEERVRQGLLGGGAGVRVEGEELGQKFEEQGLLRADARGEGGALRVEQRDAAAAGAVAALALGLGRGGSGGWGRWLLLRGRLALVDDAAVVEAFRCARGGCKREIQAVIKSNLHTHTQSRGG